MGVKYTHTNLIARDWKALAQFYIDVFECEPMYPERNLSGEWIEKMTAIGGVKVRGVHLRLPGYMDGPTLEVFQFDPEVVRNTPSTINRPGLGHIAFHVDDVAAVLEKFLAHGGSKYGELIQKQYEELGLLTAIYAADPEGNIVEIQNWKR